MIGRILTCLLIIGLWLHADAQTIGQRTIVVQSMADADAAIAVNTTSAVTTTLTATRTWTLPAASTIPKGATIAVSDLGGAIATPGNNIIVDGNGSDTINGRLTFVLSCPWGSAVLQSNGVNGWAASAEACDVPNSALPSTMNQYSVVQNSLMLVKQFPGPLDAPGAGIVRIYATHGTAAGTCKLMV
jgi:hypothetical protein